MASAKNSITFEWKTGRDPDAFMRKLVLFERALDNRLESAMQTAVSIVEADAKDRAPYEYGTLESSIASEVKADVKNAVKGYVGSNIEYAPFQEFGTSKMGAQPYLQPAIEANRSRILALFQAAVHEAAVAAGVT